MNERFPEYASRRLWHWRRQYHREQWEQLPDTVASKCSHVPNSWRKKHGLDPKGPSKNYTLPPKVSDLLEAQLLELISGTGAVMPRRDHVTKRDIEVSLSWVKTVLNKEITEQRGQIREQNEALLRSFTSGAISQKELAEGWKREPQPLKNKCLRTLQKKFAKSSGLTKQACNTSGNYLPYDDPQMCEKLEGTDNIVFASSTCGHGHVLYTAIKIDQNCSVIQYIERR